jgi:hypothetical protein
MERDGDGNALAACPGPWGLYCGSETAFLERFIQGPPLIAADEKHFQRFPEVLLGLLFGLPLGIYVKARTRRNIDLGLLFDRNRQREAEKCSHFCESSSVNYPSDQTPVSTSICI